MLALFAGAWPALKYDAWHLSRANQRERFWRRQLFISVKTTAISGVMVLAQQNLQQRKAAQISLRGMQFNMLAEDGSINHAHQQKRCIWQLS